MRIPLGTSNNRLRANGSPGIRQFTGRTYFNPDLREISTLTVCGAVQQQAKASRQVGGGASSDDDSVARSGRCRSLQLATMYESVAGADIDRWRIMQH